MTSSIRWALRPTVPRDGYGLGLSIVQRLVNLLNLRLDVTFPGRQGLDVLARAAAGSTAGTGTGPQRIPAAARHREIR